MNIDANGNLQTILASTSPNLNNFSNIYLRSGQNGGSEFALQGYTRDTVDTNWRLLTHGFTGASPLTEFRSAATEVDVQISADGASADQDIVVQGVRLDGTKLNSSPATLTGTTGVNVTFANQIVRVLAVLSVAEVGTGTLPFNDDSGVICYVSPQGQALTAGVPDANIMGTLDLGKGFSKIGSTFVAAGDIYYPNELLILVHGNDSNTNGEYARIVIQFRNLTASLWYTIADLAVKEHWLGMFSNATFNGGGGGIDIRVMAQHVGAGGCDAIEFFMNGILVSP